MSGESFTKPETTADTKPEAFDVKKWRRGAALVTRSVEVYGRPDLLGVIEDLDAQIVRLQSGGFDKGREAAKAQARELAVQREQVAAEMTASAQTFRFRGLRPGEEEAIKAEHPDLVSSEDWTTIDYKKWAKQCVSPAGLSWEDMRNLHLGDEESEGLGNYFIQTIVSTAFLANTANGVDVPFSSASSSLIANSAKN